MNVPSNAPLYVVWGVLKELGILTVHAAELGEPALMSTPNTVPPFRTANTKPDEPITGTDTTAAEEYVNCVLVASVGSYRNIVASTATYT